MKPSRCLVATLVLLVAPLTGCDREESVEEPPVRPVRCEQVFVTGGERVRTFSGSAEAGQEARLSFRVSGTVQQIAVKVGDRVRPGQLIAQLEKQDYELAVQQAEAALANAKAQQRNAEATLERVRGLYENDNASESELDAAIASDQSASAQVESAEKRLEQAKLQLSYTTLSAPTSGAIAQVLAEVNENVGSGTPIAVLTSSERAEVTVGIPEQLIAQIEEGQSAVVEFNAIPRETFDARVREVAVTATGAGTTFPVTVRLEEPVPGVRPGMAAEVSFTFSPTNGRDRIVIPAFAVSEDPRGRFVYVANPVDDGENGNRAVLERREVQVGDLTAEGELEILSGLEDGEYVVTAGVSRVRDGMEVEISDPRSLGE